VQFISTADAGEIASFAVVSTTLGGAAGCIAALFADALSTRREIGEFELNIGIGLNGALTGLVGITGACAVIEPWAAALIGAISGLIYLWSSALLLRWRIDDAIDSIPVHMFGGIWGMVATGLFASPSKLEKLYGQDEHVGLFYAFARGSDAKLLAANLVGMLYLAGFSAAVMAPFFLLLNKFGWFRADALEELVGLDCNFTGAADANADEITADGVRGMKNYRMSTNQESDSMVDTNNAEVAVEDVDSVVEEAPKADEGVA
jgi:Amt family ammonium transporter